MDHRHVVERGYSSGRASPRFVCKKRGQKDLGSQVILCRKRLCAANDCSTMKLSRFKSGHGLSWPAWCVSSSWRRRSCSFAHQAPCSVVATVEREREAVSLTHILVEWELEELDGNPSRKSRANRLRLCVYRPIAVTRDGEVISVRGLRAFQIKCRRIQLGRL